VVVPPSGSGMEIKLNMDAQPQTIPYPMASSVCILKHLNGKVISTNTTIQNSNNSRTPRVNMPVLNGSLGELSTYVEHFVKTARDTPLQDVYIPKFCKIFSFGGQCPHPCTDGSEISYHSHANFQTSKVPGII